MKTWTTTNGITIYKLLNGLFNCFLVQKGDFNLLLDTGLSRHRKKLIANLKFLLKGKSTLDYLMLTHTHFDHCENAAAVAELFCPKVIVHRSEAEFLSNGFKPLPRGTLWLVDKITALGNKHAAHRYTYSPLIADILIDDNSSFTENDLNLRIINTNGHTIGSISLIINDEIALVGDTMSGDLKFTIYPPFADDKINLVKSWGKLLETGCQIFIPGHGWELNRKIIQKYYQKHRQ
jgi:hydroxyacylglutathione hydrolase